jgi:hypothetical protein
MVTGDGVIRWGFWSQLVFLGLVDTGTIFAMQKGGVAWYHYLGFGLVNVLCLAVSVVMWRWLRDQRGTAAVDERA